MSLADLSSAALRELDRALATGQLRAPLTALELSAAGLEHLAPAARDLAGIDADAARRIIAALLTDRERRQSSVSLVWTGPEATDASARDTSVIVKELFAAARREVIVAGYSFDHGSDILAPLHAVMDRHGVKATLFLDLKDKALGAADIDHAARRQLTQWLIDNWPFGPPQPSLYYDPRTLTPGLWASLHAKCIVIDRRRALVGSANFTNRGQTRNIEVGALIDDPTFAEQLAQQWLGLADDGLLARF